MSSSGRRANAVLALPEPEPGKSLDRLRRFINVGDDDWPLVAGWLVAAMRPPDRTRYLSRFFGHYIRAR